MKRRRHIYNIRSHFPLNLPPNPNHQNQFYFSFPQRGANWELHSHKHTYDRTQKIEPMDLSNLIAKKRRKSDWLLVL